MVGGEPLPDAETATDALKILQVVASYYPAVRYGGTIVSVHGLATALAARGHDVHVYTTSVDGDRDSDVPHDQPVMLDGVHVWYFRSPNLRRLYRSPDLRAQLARTVANFDVVHTHAVFLWPLWVAARAATRAGVPYVVSPRGMLERDLIRRKSPWLKALWIALIERRNLERAAAIHVTSAREAEELASFHFQLPPVVTIPNGVDLDAPAASDGAVVDRMSVDVSGSPYVLFLGRVSWKKGLDRLVRAMPYISSGLRVIVAGGDDEGLRGSLEAEAGRLGVADRLVFTGPVAGAGKHASLSGAQLLVLPSHSENFGNVVLEAMAAGCPVVVTPEVGAAPIVEASGAGWVVSGEPATLGARISALAADAELRAVMSARGRAAAAARFSWSAVARDMEALYTSVSARPGGPS